MGIMMAGQQAALGNFLAFTRAQESSADQAGATYLSKAGISGKGSIEFFKKLQNQEYRLAIYAKDSYDRTHPLSSERIAALKQVYKADPAWNTPTDPALEARFQRVKAKLFGFVDPKQAVVKYPESDQSVPGHYARAYAYHLGAYPDKAAGRDRRLLATAPDDPFFLELKGQSCSNRASPTEAIAPLRAAVARRPTQPLIAAMLGHALVATEDRQEFRRGQAGAQDRGQSRQPQSRSPGTSSASSTTARATSRAPACHRRAQQPGRRAQARAGQRRNGDEGYSQAARPTIFARRTSPWCPRRAQEEQERKKSQLTRRRATTAIRDVGRRAHRRGARRALLTAAAAGRRAAVGGERIVREG